MGDLGQPNAGAEESRKTDPEGVATRPRVQGLDKPQNTKKTTPRHIIELLAIHLKNSQRERRTKRRGAAALTGRGLRRPVAAQSHTARKQRRCSSGGEWLQCTPCGLQRGEYLSPAPLEKVSNHCPKATAKTLANKPTVKIK